MSLLEELKDRADMLDAELLTLSSRMKEIARESEEIHTCINALDIAEMDAEDDGGTISLDRSDLTGHPNAPDEGGSSTASFDLDSLSPEERQEMIDRAVGDEAEQQRAVQAFEEQEGEDYEAVRDRAGEVEIPEGFTKWEGGYCPFSIGTTLEVFTRKTGVWPVTVKPEAPLLWEHEGHALDIIAYRVIEPQASEGEEDREPTLIDVALGLNERDPTADAITAYIEAESAPVTDPQPVVDPTAKFWGEGLMRAAEPKRERAYWPFGGKLVGG